MNDRFKFRVWDTRLKEYNAEHTYCLFEDGDLGEYDGVTPIQEWYIVEQCTGLKDKNGNLIYEGDIIKDRGEIMYKIQWKDASFFAVALDNFNYMPDCYLVQQWLNTWKAEIIGNVHEQAEQKE